MARIALNGLGRIGKLVLRRLIDIAPELEIAFVNDIGGTPEQLAILLEFDSVHGRWSTPVKADGNALIVGDRTIPLTAERDLAALDLAGQGVDLFIDCTGKFKSREKLAPVYAQGIEKVLVSAPVNEPDVLNIVYGVNDHLYDGSQTLVTAASCTTNCLAPVVKVVKESFGLKYGSFTTVHDVTNDQTIVDRAHSDPRRARSALANMIPTSTGSAKAIMSIYPELEGRLMGYAIRVPVLNASLTDCSFELEREATAEELNAAFETAANGELQDILGYETRPLVSSDYVNDSRSSIIDAQTTVVVQGTHAKIYAWYDNEWGYSCRMVDVAKLMTR